MRGTTAMWLDRDRLRHPAALVAALVLNGALVLFLAVWSRRAGEIPEAPLLAIPLDVLPPAPEPAELATSPLEKRGEISPPAPPELSLPAPPDLELPDLPPDLEVPSGIPISLPPVDSLSEVSLEVPSYRVSVQEAGEVPAADFGASRGPLLMAPPDLSRYYPRRALRKGITGKTTIRLSIGADGRAREVEVLKSIPQGIFEHAARRASRALRFQPAVKDGREVPASILLNLIWKVE